MNRVFAPEAPIDLDTLPGDGAEAGASTSHRPLPPGLAPGPKVLQTAARGPAAAAPKPKDPTPVTVLLLSALGGVGLVGALSAVLLVQQWTGLQRSLSQERNLLLMERLRALGPATSGPSQPMAPATPPAPVLDPVQPLAPQRLAESEALPPPPPEEPWMEQLSQLPPSQGRPSLLRVPVTPRLTAAAPAALPHSGRGGAQERRPSGPLPQLVGLVGAPGRAGSAIFQMGETSTNVNVGEPIGSSGWSLRAADAESALIERGGEVRRIAIVSGG